MPVLVVLPRDKLYHPWWVISGFYTMGFPGGLFLVSNHYIMGFPGDYY